MKKSFDYASFSKDYSSATVLYGDASSDYVASRCCMLNGILFRGHSLCCEAIEKALKAMYFMQNKKLHTESRHNLLNIKKDLKNSSFLDKYDDLLKFLSDAHKARYTLGFNKKANRFPDTKTGSYTSKDFIDEIDSLWLNIFDNLSIPDEMKYRLWPFPAALAINKMQNYSYWLTIENKTLSPRVNELIKESKKITRLNC